ncbi:hypothetical protein EON65_50990 [archaeon]|nr:MAG: hypothetical protein EON65_50990 [archaeon]
MIKAEEFRYDFVIRDTGDIEKGAGMFAVQACVPGDRVCIERPVLTSPADFPRPSTVEQEAVSQLHTAISHSIQGKFANEQHVVLCGNCR